MFICFIMLSGFSDTEQFNKQLRDAQQANINPTQIILVNLVYLQQQNIIELKKNTLQASAC